MTAREFRIICLAIGKNGFFCRISREACRDAIAVMHHWFGQNLEDQPPEDESGEPRWQAVTAPQLWRGHKGPCGTVEGGLYWSKKGEPYIVRMDDNAGVMLFAVDPATLEVSECPERN